MKAAMEITSTENRKYRRGGGINQAKTPEMTPLLLIITGVLGIVKNRAN
jgi:hypothetical protein